MKHALALFAALAVLAAPAEQYRLKYAAAVDILEGSTVTGQKRLKAGTVVTLAETATPSEAADAKPKSKLDRSPKLVASDMTPAIWKNKRPPHNVFRAEIVLTDSYYYSWSEKKNTHWSVRIYARGADWSYVSESWLTGYVLKSSPVGKRIETALSDGKEHRALVQVKPTKFKDETDFCVIEDFEIVTGD